MDELHVRVKAVRSPPLNLVKQPHPVDDPAGAQIQGEASVVEMPLRQAPEAPLQAEQSQRSAPRRKQSTVTQPRAAATSQMFSFQQMRDGHQQPYMDELKRLEAQAERINQLLADRKRKQARAEQSVALTTDQPLIEANAARKKKAPKRARPSRSLQQEVPPMPAPDDDTEVSAQAERIKQLLQELETALVEEALPPGNAIEPNVQDQAQAADLASEARSHPDVAFVGTYRYGADALPPIDQIIVGTTEPTQQEATKTAQALRSLTSREPLELAINAPSRPLRHHPRRSRDQRSSASPFMRRHRLRLRQFFQIPQTSLDRVGDAVLWIVLAAASRMGAQLLLVPFPALAPVLLTLMLVPAAFAVYLALYVPKVGFVSIYRLFLIMLGLLLGGRF